MKIRATTRALLAVSLIAAVLLVPGTAMGGDCTFGASPNPGWRGGTTTFSGFAMSPNTGYTVNFDGQQIKSGTTNGSGNFSFNYVIPLDTEVGHHNWIAFTADVNGCYMEDARDYVVNAGPPATTTTTAATTTTTTTTTLAPTTTTPAPTTTLAPTTTVAGDTTTTAATDTTVSDTTTTTVAAEDDGGGIPIYIWVAIAALVGLVLFLIGKMSARRR